MNKNILLKKIVFFKKHIDMYLLENKYENTVAFILGMDFSFDGKMLEGFREWLLLQYNVRSNLSWMKLVELIYADNVNEGISKVDFLLDNLMEYVASM
ncbi:hypothetical protein AB1A27_23305 [Escherichia coli]